jgi:hypothetical protein
VSAGQLRNLVVSRHPAVQHKLALLRDGRVEPKKFRELVREISWLVGYEALADARLRPIRVPTPLEETDGVELADRIGLVPILRAGLGMVDAMLELMPTAQVWHLGLFRDERTLRLGLRLRLLLMLDEFPALGRLDFFESALAFMAGYGLKSFLIAQSLNQIEKAYGPNNAILDNCHVRVAFATNDERTAKRASDALGTATELRDSTNYAGHRLAPWLGHLMVSRQETARPLLTPGEIMQLPPTDEIVMVAGTPPIRAEKARYFEDVRFQERILPPPDLAASPASVPAPSSDDWSSCVVAAARRPKSGTAGGAPGDPVNAGIRREPELPEHEEVVPPPPPAMEFELLDDEPEMDAVKARALRSSPRRVARQVSMNPDDGIEL